MREKILENGGNPDDFPILRDDTRPTLFRDVEWVWEGFVTLSGSRQTGYGVPQPIQLSEILSYLEYRGIRDPDEQQEFVFLVQSLDRRFMANAIARSQRQTGSPSPPGKPPR